MAGDKRYAKQIDPTTLRWRVAGEVVGEVVGDHPVEIAELPDGGYAMREGGRGDHGEILWFTPAEWHAFVAGVNDGEFDLE